MVGHFQSKRSFHLLALLCFLFTLSAKEFDALYSIKLFEEGFDYVGFYLFSVVGDEADFPLASLLSLAELLAVFGRFILLLPLHNRQTMGGPFG